MVMHTPFTDSKPHLGKIEDGKDKLESAKYGNLPVLIYALGIGLPTAILCE